MREPALPVPLRAFDEPAAAPAVRRPVPVIPRHVFLDVTVDVADRSVRGSVHHTVEARVGGEQRLPFDAADLVVHGAFCDETPLRFVAHAEGVEVWLDAPLAPDAQVTVRLDYTARPTVGLCFVPPELDAGGTTQVWTQGAMEDHHHWFPCFDAPEHMVTTEVRATVPAGCVALSNGEPQGEQGAPAGEGQVVWHWRHDTPHALYLLTLVVDRVVEVADAHGDVTLHHWVPPGREADARVLFERMGPMLDFLSEVTGQPYPYSRYGHVFLRNFMWGGMENTTLTSLTDQVLVPAEHRAVEDVERLFAHELAHQWFGDLIAPRGWPEIWLNESFATWFEIRCMGALNGADDFVRRLLTQRDSYLAEAQHRYARAVVTRRYAHPYVLFDRHAYEKGGLVLHTLRDQLGATAFDAGLKRYVAQVAGTAAETADFRRCLEATSGVDLTDFFEDFIYGAEHPKVAVAWRYTPELGLAFDLKRTDATGQRLQLTVMARVGDAVVARRVPLAPGQRTVIIDLPGPPAWVALDPTAHCLVEVDETPETDTALLARLIPNAGAPIALRVRTARLLGFRPSATVRAALIASLRSDPSATVRAEVATALGNHRHAAARDALAEVLSPEAFTAGQPVGPLSAEASADGWRVRAAAARALGLGAEVDAVPRLIALMDVEPNHRVLAALLTGLGRVRSAEARAAIEPYLDRLSDPRACVAVAALGALVAQEDPACAEACFARAEAPWPLAVRQTALRGLATLAKVEGAERALKRRVRERLEAALFSPIFGLRMAATDAVVTLGDAALAPALRRAHDAELFGMLRRGHREALGKLEKPAS